jgi:hypothetical protein
VLSRDEVRRLLEQVEGGEGTYRLMAENDEKGTFCFF